MDLFIRDWLFAIQDVYQEYPGLWHAFCDRRRLDTRPVGHLEKEKGFPPDQLKDIRQSEDIRRALDILENVDRLNQPSTRAIHLPSVRTPSQIKKFYEPVMDANAVQIMDAKSVTPDFELPTFGQEKTRDREPRSVVLSMNSCSARASWRRNHARYTASSLGASSTEPAVKARIKLERPSLLSMRRLWGPCFKRSPRVRREAPLPCWKKDPASGEDFRRGDLGWLRGARGRPDPALWLQDGITTGS